MLVSPGMRVVELVCQECGEDFDYLQSRGPRRRLCPRCGIERGKMLNRVYQRRFRERGRGLPLTPLPAKPLPVVTVSPLTPDHSRASR